MAAHFRGLGQYVRIDVYSTIFLVLFVVLAGGNLIFA